MKGRHVASLRRGLDPLWVVVAVVAISVRLGLGLGVGLTPYSGDSWCLLHLGGVPLCASHPPTISWLWRILTLGTFTQGSVLLLQGVLGVLGALVQFSVLRRGADRRLAAAAALLVAVMPVELFMERAIMTEAVETFLLLAALWLGMWALRASSRASALGRLAATALVLGIDAAIHAAIAPTVVALLMLLVGLVAWRQVVSQASGSVVLLVLTPIVAVLLLVAPSVPMGLRYHSTFGTYSTQAMAGTYMAASWAPLLDCPAPPRSQPAVQDFYAVACTHRGFGDPPGIVTKLMWAPSLSFLRTEPGPAQRAAFVRAQSALASAALAGIAHHPTVFLHEMVRALGAQMTVPPTTRALHVYSTGRPRWEAAQRGTSPAATAVRQWFGRAVPSASRPSPDLSTAVRMTDALPQVLLWLAGLSGVIRLVLALRRRRAAEPLERAGWRHRPPSDRVSLGLLCVVIVVTGLLAWAFGSWPIFRLWSPLVPAIAILVVLAVPHRAPEVAVDPERDDTGAEPAAAISG